MRLVWPSAAYLPGYVAALEAGWLPSTLRAESGREHLATIGADAAEFIRYQIDREAKGPPVTLPDGSTVPRIPGYHRWLWDGEFCGSIGFRWQPGTAALPQYLLGHIGYGIVPWKQRKGYATLALRLLLEELKAKQLPNQLPHVDLVTDPENLASQRVILANGGKLVERFTKPPQFGSGPGLRFRIIL